MKLCFIRYRTMIFIIEYSISEKLLILITDSPGCFRCIYETKKGLTCCETLLLKYAILVLF